MAWKPIRHRPLGKPGSAVYPAQLLGLQGRQLVAGWKAVRDQRALEARMAALMGPVEVAGPKGRKR